MGLGVQVYSVDWPYVTSRIGSRDPYIRERVRPDLLELWDPKDHEADEVMPPEALDRMLDGQVPARRLGGDAYYAAVAGIYRHFGLFVGNLALSGRAVEFLEAVEAALKAAGGRPPLSLLDLVFRGVPFELPPGGEPSLGYLDPAEVLEASSVYDTVSLMGMHGDVLEVVQEFGGWLKYAGRRGHGLVGVIW